MSRTTRFIAVAGLTALLSAGAATAACAAPVTAPGVIGWDSARAVAADASGSAVIGWDSAAADKRVIGWD
ncbi:hypothetical protein AB0N28_28685 [Streptomyces sp. NPDC051130]|uniref:hypothetical protein n=1 Tax=Streptomyces sp. NPDC051130 TaxID=3157223 RepID=UPI00342D4088